MSAPVSNSTKYIYDIVEIPKDETTTNSCILKKDRGGKIQTTHEGCEQTHACRTCLELFSETEENFVIDLGCNDVEHDESRHITCISCYNGMIKTNNKERQENSKGYTIDLTLTGKARADALKKKEAELLANQNAGITFPDRCPTYVKGFSKPQDNQSQGRTRRRQNAQNQPTLKPLCAELNSNQYRYLQSLSSIQKEWQANNAAVQLSARAEITFAKPDNGLGLTSAEAWTTLNPETNDKTHVRFVWVIGSKTDPNEPPKSFVDQMEKSKSVDDFAKEEAAKANNQPKPTVNPIAPQPVAKPPVSLPPAGPAPRPKLTLVKLARVVGNAFHWALYGVTKTLAVIIEKTMMIAAVVIAGVNLVVASPLLLAVAVITFPIAFPFKNGKFDIDENRFNAIKPFVATPVILAAIPTIIAGFISYAIVSVTDKLAEDAKPSKTPRQLLNA